MTNQPGTTGDLAQQSSPDGTGEPPQDPDFVSATSDVAAPDESAAVLVAGQPDRRGAADAACDRGCGKQLAFDLRHSDRA